MCWRLLIELIDEFDQKLLLIERKQSLSIYNINWFINREQVQMLKQIKILNHDTFSKIPLYPRIFTPFLPSSSKRRQNSKKEVKLEKENEIIFKYLSMVMESTRKDKDKMGVEYIYGYDCSNGILDIASVSKNQRYRFILPPTCRNKQTGYDERKCIHECNVNKYDEWSMTGIHFEIKSKLLILVYRAHVYIHDLVRHNQQTNPSALDNYNYSKDKKSVMGLITLRQNSHYIYKLEYEQNSVYVYVKLYSIDMANNYEVKFQCDHIIRITEQCAKIQALNVIVYDGQDKEGQKLILCTQIEQTYPKCTRIILHALSIQQDGQNVSLRINMFEADSLILNHSSIINERNYSKIRSSWVPIQKDNRQQNDRAILSPSLSYIHAQLSGSRIIIGYKKDKAEIIMIHLAQHKQKQSKYVCTNIIEHQCNILDIQSANNKLFILDFNLNLWTYQFPESSQQHQSIINYTLLMEPLLICTFQSQLHNIHPQYASLSIKANNMGVMLDTSCYICYPNIMLPILDTLAQEQALILVNVGLNQQLLVDESSLFLSVQQSKFVGNMSIAHQLISKMVKPYIPMLNENQTFNIRQYLAEEVIPKIGQITQIRKQICFPVKYQIVSQIINVICGKLRQIKTLVLGSIHDCEQNHFYWLISQLFNHRQQKDICMRDIFRVLETMTKQKQDIKSVISTILIQQKLLVWLKQKCDTNLYQIVCTSNFVKCSLSGGCPCVYKRLIKCLFMINIEKERNQYELKKNIISILIKGNQQIKQRKEQNWIQDIQSMMLMRFKQQKQKMESMQKMKIQKIDDQFQYLFTRTRANTNDTRLEKQNMLHEQDEGQNILQKNTIKDKNIDVFIQLSTKGQNCFNHVAVSYRVDDGQYNDMIQQSLSLYPQFTSNIISLYNEIAVNNFELKVILSDIQQLLKREKLLSNQMSSKTLGFNKQNMEQKQNKRKKLLMIGILVYKIYSKFNKIYTQQSINSSYYNDSLESKFRSSFSMSRPMISQNYTQLLRQLWMLTLQIISYSMQSKYQKNSQIVQMCKLFLQSMTNSRLIPALALLLEKVSNNKSLMYDQLYCLMESFIYTELYRFNQTDESNKQIKRNMEDIYQHEFKYERDTWQKGIKKILNVYNMLQFSTN